MSSLSDELRPAEVDYAVDLDTDLLRGDLAREAFWYAVRHDWTAVRHAPAALFGDTAATARILADQHGLDVDHLPYDVASLDRVRAARAEGRRTVLTAPADPELAERVAAHLDCFDAVEIVPRPRRGTAVAATPGPGVGLARLAATIKAMRPHQWVKNVLVFLPMVADHSFTPSNILWSLVAFFSFGLVASSVYVLNDLIDLPSDRRHPTKRARPFASGALPLSAGSWLLPGLLAAGLALAATGGVGLFAVMVVYALTTTAYSMKLKGKLGADIVLLAVLYTLRIIAGAAATEIEPSMWLLSFSIFVFLSLAAVKRLSELVDLETDGGDGKAAGRAYVIEDRPVVAMIATTSGFLSVLVLALYIDSPEVSARYANPHVLWGLGIALLYWISRTVLLAHRGQVNQDPVMFALTDRISRFTALVMVVLFLAAIPG